MDVIRIVPDEDVDFLAPTTRDEVADFQPRLPSSLKQAIDDYVLAMAGRHQRGQWTQPCTMLVHTSYRRELHDRLTALVDRHVQGLANQWRYPGASATDIVERLRERWELDFRLTTRDLDPVHDIPFEQLRPSVDVVLSATIEVRQINSSSADELDFEREPSLKAIVIGGNRLSRGLTVEGLVVSYFVRRARNYDTLMQMERWCGYRPDYIDLTRIHTTTQLAQWFRDLVAVESEMRASILRYELLGATPRDFSLLIPTHHTLLVTDRLKMRRIRTTRHTSYSGESPSTTSFLLDRQRWLLDNQTAARSLLSSLGAPSSGVGSSKPRWVGVPWQQVVEFLAKYRTDPEAISVSAALLDRYIRQQVAKKELVIWNVAVMGQESTTFLGTIDLDIDGCSQVNMILRSRVKGTSSSIKGLMSPPDLFIGLPRGATNITQRKVREGTLLIYPISRWSGWLNGQRDPQLRRSRVPLFDDVSRGADVIGIAMLFPVTDAPPSRAWISGSAGAGPL